MAVTRGPISIKFPKGIDSGVVMRAKKLKGRENYERESQKSKSNKGDDT